MPDFTEYPLPWKARESGGVWMVEDAFGRFVCTGRNRDIAHLIAASPELFAACGTAIAVFNGVDAGLGKKVIANTKAYETILLATARAREEVE